MPLQATSGAASYDAFGGGVAAVPNYIEDVFSTWLYTGNDQPTQKITNGIDLAGKGGLVWKKARNAGTNHELYDSSTGPASGYLRTNATNGLTTRTAPYQLTFAADGYNDDLFNNSAYNYASWTFRKQPKFFDVVTYTGNGAGTRDVPHSLGSKPGFVVIKRTDSTSEWGIWHRGNGTTAFNSGALNSTIDIPSSTSFSGLTSDTTFRVGTSGNLCITGPFDFFNVSGATYVAYIFAHNAGGFGLTGTDNVISCGSFTGLNGPQVDLGWEPQWLLIKPINYCNTAGDWFVIDNMRGARGTGTQLPRERFLHPNLNIAESLDSGGTYGNCDSININSTGFKAVGYPFNGVIDGGYRTYIYIAIRRGPMKTPTTGTSVLGINARTGTGANATVTGGLTADAALIKNRGSSVADLFASRLTGTGYLVTSSNSAEVAAGTTILQANPWDVMDGVKVGTTSTITNASGNTFINYLFKRAPGFFDVVCYTGTGVASTVNHNLGVAPELMIIKRRSPLDGYDWAVYNKSLTSNSYGLYLNAAVAETSLGASWFNSTNPTTSVFSVGTGSQVNSNTATYVAYLFATCPGVSKVGSYTGSGTTQQINCGFSAGARFVLIKRTDSTGDWYVWDSARGIVAGNDPYLLLNSTAAEVTSTDYIDTYSAGFEISSTAPAAINANGGTFIFLAIA